MSPQHDAVIANASGAAVRQDLNNALAALITNSSGATSPASTYAFQFWADTTANQLKIRNSANDAWITLMELDGTMLMEDGSAASPGLSFSSDTDTGLFRPAANQLGIATSGVERVEFGTTEVVFNDSGADVDLRVEGDAEANLLKVDAGNDRIGIAESAPGTLVEIGSTAPYVTLKNSTEEDTDGGRESRLIFEGEQSGGEISTLAQVEVSHDGTADDEKGKLVISTNDGSDGASPTAALTIGADQTVAVEDNLTVNGVQYPTAGALSHRNLIANGNFRIDQRNGGASITTSSGNNFPVDRWLLFDSAGSDFTSEQDTDAPAGHDFSLLITSAAATSPGANDYYFVCQRIEGNNVAHLNFGSSDAQTVTISFYVKSNLTGTFSGALGNASFNRAYPFTYSISEVDTWEPKTVTIAGDTAGTWATDNTTGLQVLWDLGSGTNRVGTAGAWVGSDHRGVSSSIQVVATSGATFRLAGCQVEVGSKATPFEHRSYGDELARCQRYYQRINGDATDYRQVAVGVVGTATNANRCLVPLKVSMRTNPNIDYNSVDAYDASGAYAVTSFTNYSTIDQASFDATIGTSSLTVGRAATILTRNSSSSYFALLAEL